MEQLRLQAQAVEDQRALLSPPAVQREREPSMDSHRASASSHHSPDSSTSAPGGEGEESSSSGAQPIGIPSSSHPRKSHDRSQSGGSLRSLVGSRPGTPKGPSEGFGPGSLPRNEGGFSSSGASSGQMAGSPPTAGDKEKGRENFFSALRSKEGWDAARKEAPKKLNALISRMREGATSERGGSSGLMPSGNASSGGSGGTSPSGGITPLPNDGAVTPHSGAMLGGGPGTLRSAQNIALKSVKAKREAGEADTAYRKAVFDLETLRIRREKTMAAAEASVLECQRELALTAQAIWLQAERVAIVCNGAAVSLHEHAESVVVKCIDNLDTELANSLGRLPSTRSEDLDERPVPYVN